MHIILVQYHSVTDCDGMQVAQRGAVSVRKHRGWKEQGSGGEAQGTK